jgi:glycosyltransferase involved in cell wall biosynthesis
MIVFFGKHEIIDQWRSVIGRDPRFAFCQTYDELAEYLPSETIVIYVRIPNKASLRIAVKLWIKGYKVCKFWAGTDSRYFNDARFFEKLLAKLIYKLCIYRNFSPAKWLSDVLEMNGLTTQYWQSCSPIFLQAELLNVAEIPTNNKEKVSKVLVYSNPDRHWIYSTEMMLALAEELPHIHFVFVGDESLEVDCLSNVDSLGRISTEALFELYQNCQMLVRITTHDGFSRMIIEGMYFGVNVITNWPVPHTHQANSIDEIKVILAEEVHFNRKGYDYIRSEFNLDAWKSTLLSHLSS